MESLARLISASCSQRRWPCSIILFNTTIATAIADRLIENSEIFPLGGDSLKSGWNYPPPGRSVKPEVSRTGSS
jgi:hypothetical protein